MSDNKELHYRKNGMSHLKTSAFWFLTIVGVPLGAVYFSLAAVELSLAALHWIAGVLRFFF